MAALEANLDASVCEQDEYHDALGPEELQELWQLDEKEILDIAGEIGDDWMIVGIQLGYTRVMLSHLEEVYPKQPKWRNFMMIAEWCDVVSHLGLNVEQYLAKFLADTGHADIADNLGTDYNIVVTSPEEIFKHVKHISFDKPIPKVLGIINMAVIENYLGIAFQARFELNLGGPSEQKESITAIGNEWKEKSGDAVDSVNVWSMDKMTVALYESSFEAKDTALSKLLVDLSLERYYPAKILLSDIQEIKPEQELNETNLPWLLLNKIVMLNYSAREEDLNNLFERKRAKNYADSESDSDDGLFDDNTVNYINPMDLFYAAFLCCHPILKQDIISKMFACKLAIPFIYTDFKHQLTLSQWALRKILIEKRLDDKILQIDPLQNEIKIVSFLRIGSLCMSKSKIINEILHDKYHPTFFNRDCHLGTTSRKVADGIVEASWFIPSGRENDIFNDIIMVLNLRGDSMHYSTVNEIVCKLSHAIVVHVDIEKLTLKEVKDALLGLHQHNIPVIYALESNNEAGTNPAEIWKTYKASIKIFKTQIKVLNLKTPRQTKSSSDITKEMRKFLSDSLQDKKPIRLINLTKNVSIVDEKIIKECSQSKAFAADVMNEIANLEPTEKERILPLQGRPWSTWCADLKKLFKSKSGVEQDHLKSRMNLLRTEQVHNVENLHKFVSLFIKYLDLQSKGDMEQTVFFLNWMKIYLDEKTRCILPYLISKYQKSCVSLRSAVENHRLYEIDNLRLAVDNAEQDLAEASFGLEHIIRELGQIYEAVMSKSVYTNSSVQKLPEFVSKLIQCGYPLEIMNGDTATVPSLWVESVLNQLQQDIGDKKLLTISVLGIQSSGKSTLLNAMFGLQFAVSAGRCTKGVFAQLVKVQEGILPYEYVFIIDTEGLRAPELGDKKQTHDNELATFVLGLGNITVINIKGENTQEMEDVLQIAVHAFLRLKMANSNMKLDQTCIFVHQNVPAIDASTKMIHSRQKMMDKLDKLTREAAKQEGIADINSFNQVIEVNPETHMWYFSDLWSGDPPMAPINDGYSRSVQEVKRHILFEFAKRKNSFLTISETTEQMKDLWYGILSDNFVFSFRNSLEVKAYHTMDAKFHKLMWNIEWKMLRYVQKKAYSLIMRCANEEMLEKETNELLKTLHSFLQQQLQDKTDQWNSFIDNCPLQEMMEQWRQNRIAHLTENVNDLVRNGEKNIRNMKAQQAADLVSTKKRTMHELELRMKAEALANHFKETSLSEKDLIGIFNRTYDKWVSKLEHANPEEKRSVEDDTEKILFELFQADSRLIRDEIKRKENTLYEKMHMLENSITIDELKDSYISVSQAWFKKFFKVKKDQCKHHALSIINMILGNIDNFVGSVMFDDSPFEKTHVKEVFMILIDSINKHNAGIDETQNFTFTAALRVKLAVHVAKYITIVFTNKDKIYEANHNVMAQIENYKTSTWEYFKDIYRNKKDEVTTANMLVRNVERIVKSEIEKDLPRIIVKTILLEHFPTKHSLMVAVMTDLANAGNFERYIWYITDAENFVLKWITRFITDLIFKTNEKSNSKYMVIVTSVIDKHIKRIIRSSEYATVISLKKKSDVNIWVKLFEKDLSLNLPVPLGEFSVPESRKVDDLHNLYKCFKDQLMEMRESLASEFLKESTSVFLWKGDNPCKTIFDRLWGCRERCPFCREVCEKTTKRHALYEKHSCLQHRPSGVIGCYIERTNVMAWESCNYQVYSNRKFYCSASHRMCQAYGMCKAKGKSEGTHFYKDYSRFIPNWKIVPSPLMESTPYWLWFVYTYYKELSLKYNYNVPTNVLKWGSITKEVAIKSLQKQSYPIL